MAYGQKNYLETQGINGKYRISQIGCFLTSFSNLLERFGKGQSPLDLNREFKSKGIYLDVDDGIRDDLAFTSITKYNPNIVVTGTGVGAPKSNNAIVKFTGLNNGFGTHFCLVADAAKGLIVDSWDGVVKSWNVYGGPKSWAAYEDRTPKPTPKPTPAPAPVVNGDFVTVQAGWGLSHVAQAAGYGDFKEPSRWTEIARLNGFDNWQSYNSSLKKGQQVRVRGAAPAPKPTPAPQPAPTPAPQPEVVTITVGPGWGITHVLKAAGYPKVSFDRPEEWDRTAALNGSATRLRFKPGDKVRVYKNPLPLPQAAPAAAPQPTPAPAAPAPVEKVEPVTPVAEQPKPAPVENEDGSVTVPVNVVPKDPKAYQKTLVEEDKVYIATTSKVIHDIDKLHMDLQLVAGQKVTSGGRFWKEDEKGNEIEYVISKKHLDLGQWYGINKDFLGEGKDPNAYVGPLVDDDSDLDDIFNMDLALELKEALGNLSGREKLINFLGKLYDIVLKLKFWDRKNKTA